MRLLAYAALLLITACSNKGMYDNIKHNQCVEKTGNIYCDDIEDYDNYKKKREELLKDSNENMR